MDKTEEFIELFIDVWKNGISGINISEIIIALIIFFLFLFLRGLFAKFIIKRLEKYVSKTSNKFDNTLVESLKGPTKFFPIVVGFFVATSYVSLGDSTESFIDNANRTLITILIFWSLHQIIGPISVLIKTVEDLLSKDLLNWIIKAFKILILILGAAAVLELWGIKIGPIIAGLGLFGVAVALGAQDLFKNLISGILVLVEKRFKVGDWILVENIIEGIVEKIGFRSTVVRKFDKSVAVIPNFQFAENAVINISETTNWRINWIITLQYDTTVDQLKKIRDEIDKYITTSKDYKISENTTHAVRIDKFSDSSIDMYVRCFTNTNRWSEWLKVKERLAIAIKEIVERNKASFAFPSQSIYVEKKKKMKSVLILIDSLVSIYIWVLIINALLSWLIAFNVLNTSNRLVYSLLDISYKMTDPLLRPIRNFLPNLGGIDISPVILILLLMFLRNLVFEFFAPALF